MAKIRIADLDRNVKLTEQQMKYVAGGAAYMKYEDIDGESKDANHGTWLGITSPLIAPSVPGVTGPSVDSVTLPGVGAQEIDKASPKLA